MSLALIGSTRSISGARKKTVQIIGSNNNFCHDFFP